MRVSVTRIAQSLAAVATVLLAVAPALCGSMDLEWAPATGADIAGYRIYAGSRPDALTVAADVPNVSSSSLGSLTACSYYYVAVKARDSHGMVSDQFSNFVEGYPHPDVVSVTPAILRRGFSGALVVTGSNFIAGAAAVFEDRKIQVRSSAVNACGQMTLQIVVAQNATEGPAALTITNPDGGFNTTTSKVRVVSEGTGVPLQILSVTPAPGATGVDAMAPIRVHFSAAVDPASISEGRFKIAKADGKGAAPLAGPPVIDSTGTWVTLTPAAPLRAGAAYTIVVKGGHGGVHDASGNPIDADVVQDPAFTTRDLIASLRFGAADQVAASGATLTEGGSVPTVSAFVVRFTEAMDPMTITAKTLRIRVSGKGKVKLMDGNPVLLADGISVLMIPAEPLDPTRTFTIQVKGGANGVASVRGVVMVDGHDTTFTTALAVVDGLGVAE